MKRNWICFSFISALIFLGGCATTDFSPAEKEAWVVAQEERFNVLATAYTPTLDWYLVYQDIAQKVWALGHNGEEFTWPIHTVYIRSSIPVRPIITSEFGDMFNSIGQPRGGPHHGIDIPAPEGTPVLAIDDGVVFRSRLHEKNGEEIKIRHGAIDTQDEIRVQYYHLSTRLVNIGDKVRRGDVIGTVGSTGSSNESKVPHLHLAIWRLRSGRVGDNRAYSNVWTAIKPDFTQLSYPLKIEECVIIACVPGANKD